MAKQSVRRSNIKPLKAAKKHAAPSLVKSSAKMSVPTKGELREQIQKLSEQIVILKSRLRKLTKERKGLSQELVYYKPKGKLTEVLAQFKDDLEKRDTEITQLKKWIREFSDRFTGLEEARQNKGETLGQWNDRLLIGNKNLSEQNKELIEENNMLKDELKSRSN